MLNIIEATLNEVKLGDPQHYRNMSVFPLLFSGKSKLEYSMLGKALNEGHIMITEISENGSVPELKLFNAVSHPGSVATAPGATRHGPATARASAVTHTATGISAPGI